MKKLFLIILIVSITLNVWLFLKIDDKKEITKTPLTMNLSGRDSYACTGYINASIREEYDADQTKIIGNVEDGTDKIAIAIKEDKMVLQTAASVETGIAHVSEEDMFTIIRNDQDYLESMWVSNLSSQTNTVDTIDTFFLNKKTGLGVWNRTRNKFFLGENPESSAIYVTCL